MWGSNNDSDRDPICPIPLLCCYLTEIMCFRLVFNETVDHCGCGDKSAKEIFNEFGKGSISRTD